MPAIKPAAEQTATGVIGILATPGTVRRAYLDDLERQFAAGKTVKADDREFTASGDPDDLDGIRQFAVAYLRNEQDIDLQAFGVKFDNYYLESSLYQDGKVEKAVEALIAARAAGKARAALAVEPGVSVCEKKEPPSATLSLVCLSSTAATVTPKPCWKRLLMPCSTFRS